MTALEKAGKPAIDIHTFGTYADVLQALEAGQVDGAFIGTEQAFYYRRKGQDFFRIALTGYDPHAEALAFKDPALADAVVTVMNDMHADGTMDKIFKPYGHCLLPGPYKVTSGAICRRRTVPAANAVTQVSRSGGAAAFRICQAKMVPQHRAFVLGAEQTAALQHRNRLIDEHVELVGEIGRHDVETVAAAGFEPEAACDRQAARACRQTCHATATSQPGWRRRGPSGLRVRRDPAG